MKLDIPETIWTTKPGKIAYEWKFSSAEKTVKEAAQASFSTDTSKIAKNITMEGPKDKRAKVIITLFRLSIIKVQFIVLKCPAVNPNSLGKSLRFSDKLQKLYVIQL